MTMTDPDQTTEGTSMAPRICDTSLERPTRRQMVAAVRATAKCSRRRAGHVIDYLSKVHRISVGRDGTFYPHHVRQAALDTIHPVLDLIMPDDTRPLYGDGSAHDVINRGILDATAGQQTFFHSKAYGVVRDCTVTILVETVG